jgi:hypothetical protein
MHKASPSEQIRHFVYQVTPPIVRARASPATHKQTHAIIPVCVLAISFFARATEHDFLCACERREMRQFDFPLESFEAAFCLFARSAHREKNFLCAFYFGLSVLEDLTSKAKNLRQCRANDQIACGNSPPVRHIA